MDEFVTVAHIGDIPANTGQAYQVGDRMVALFQSNGNYFAIDDTCPHMGASLASGHLEDGNVTCPWHAWRFSVCDGTWCDNPTVHIDSFEVRIVGTDIQVRISRNVDEKSDSK